MARKSVDDPSAAAAVTFDMTPMIDVCFQLIVVFLCSMKFRTLDQKIEAFLPTSDGMDPTRRRDSHVETLVEVRLRRAPGEDRTRVSLLDTGVGLAGAAGTWDAVRASLRRFVAADPSLKGEIAADPEVPHEEVMRALDAFAAAEVLKVSFRGTKINRDGLLGPPRK